MEHDDFVKTLLLAILGAEIVASIPYLYILFISPWIDMIGDYRKRKRNQYDQ